MGMPLLTQIRDRHFVRLSTLLHRLLIAGAVVAVALLWLVFPSRIRMKDPPPRQPPPSGEAIVFAPLQAKDRSEVEKTYAVDLEKSRIYVRVDADGRGHAHGTMASLASGTVSLGADNNAGELVFDLTTMDADSVEARQYVGLQGTMSASDRRKIHQAMHGPEVLDTSRFPRAVFSIASITSKKEARPGEYQVEGRLNLHGVDRNLKFDARIEKAKSEEILLMKGRFSLHQTDYNIRPYSAFFGLVKVKNELQIYGDLWLIPRAKP